MEPFVSRVSMTLPRLANAKQIVFLATGDSKADAVAAAFGPEAKPDPHVPSSLLAPLAKEIKVLLDPPAAAGIGPGRDEHDLVIGVDLGGTKVAVAPLVGRHFGESVLLPTDRSGSGALIEQLVAMVNKIRSDDLAAVGIGVPSIVEFDTGTVVSSVNIPLKDVSLRSVLGERLGVPVFVDNDATVAALAEAHDAELRLVAHNLVMITIGTGVGGGIVLGGRIYRGSTGGAGEFGHTLVGLDLSGPAVPESDALSPTRVARVRGGGARARPARG